MTNGNGNSSVRIVAILAILVLVGFVAWFVWGRSKPAAPPAAQSPDADIELKVDLPDTITIK